MGTEEFWVPAVIAAVSAGGEAVNQSDANSRETNVEMQNIQEQQQLQNQAAGGVNKVIQQAQQNPQTTAALKAQSLADYTNQLRNAAAVAQGTGPTTGAPGQPGASKRYAAQTAAGTTQANQFADTTAQDAAGIQGTLRGQQIMGNQMQDEGTNLQRLSDQSSQDSFINSLRAQAAGQQNPWVQAAASTGLAAAGGLQSSGLLAPAAGAGSAASTAGTAGFTAAGTPIAAGGTDTAGFLNGLKSVYGAGAGMYG